MTPQKRDFFPRYVQLLADTGRVDRIEFMLELCAAVLIGDFELVNQMQADLRDEYRARFGRPAPYVTGAKCER